MDKSISCGHEKDDLISRRAAIDAVYKCTDYYVGNLPVMIDKADAYKALADLPTVDAVPVVRCKDCIYGEKDEYGWLCTNIDGGIMGDGNGSGFCCEGERREENEVD